MNTWQHVFEALTAIASKSWHGKGCKKRNCGTHCLCAPCHARVALERLNERKEQEREQALIDNTERRIVEGAMSRWRTLSKTSPSGKAMFVCLSCGYMHVAPQKTCREPVKLWNGQMRKCEDWTPPPLDQEPR